MESWKKTAFNLGFENPFPRSLVHFRLYLSPDYVVDADDAVGPRRPRVVDDGEVALDPHPAAGLGQEAVVLGARLALV